MKSLCANYAERLLEINASENFAKAMTDFFEAETIKEAEEALARANDCANSPAEHKFAANQIGPFTQIKDEAKALAAKS